MQASVIAICYSLNGILIITCCDLRINNWKYLVKILEKIIGGKFYGTLRDVVKDKYKKISPSLYWNLRHFVVK